MKNKCFVTVNIILLSCFICLLTSCSKKEPQSQAKGTVESEKIPSQLTGMEDNIEKLIKTLGGPASKTSESQGEESSGSQGQGSSGGGQGQSSGGSQGGQGQGGQSGQSQGGQGQGGQGSSGQSQQKDIWSETGPIITKLHYQWNDFISEVAKKGANKQLIDKYSDALNNLSKTNEGKDVKQVLVAGSNLYGILPDFYSLYKSKEVSPGLKRVKHYVRDTIISSMNNNWAQADSDITTLKSSWTISKNTIPKEQQDLVNKLDYSIYELEKVEKEKDLNLTEIKGKVAMTNIDAIEKAMKSSGGSS